MSARFWRAGESYVLLLAAIFGVAAGLVLTFTICSEFLGRMVLLIPAAINKLKDEGRKEANREWVGWNERRMAAERDGLPFDEPPPAGPQSRNGR